MAGYRINKDGVVESVSDDGKVIPLGGKKHIPFLLICAVLCFAMGVWAYGDDMPGCAVLCLIVGFSGLIGALYLCNALIEAKDQTEEVDAKEQARVKRNFYAECKKNGITTLASAAEKQKADLIAKNMDIKCESLEDFFAQAKKLGEAEEERKNAEKLQAELSELRKAEQEKHSKLTKYASFAGREKRIAMLNDVIDECERAVPALMNGAEITLRESQEKELDWATFGGIASGLAGGAAGLATAADIQAKNAQIRANNQARKEAVKPRMMAMYNAAIEYKREGEAAKAALDAAKLKLVAEDSAESALSRLSIEVDRVTISKTGAFELKATMRLKKPFTIFETVNAVVDGTISADLYQEGTKVGSALLVLPTFGVGEKVTIEGIGLHGAKVGVPYKVKFTAHKLWEMEA